MYSAKKTYGNVLCTRKKSYEKDRSVIRRAAPCIRRKTSASPQTYFRLSECVIDRKNTALVNRLTRISLIW